MPTPERAVRLAHRALLLDGGTNIERLPRPARELAARAVAHAFAPYLRDVPDVETAPDGPDEADLAAVVVS